MKKYLIVIAVVVVFGAVAFIFFPKHATPEEIATTASMTSREVTLRCTTDMATEYHIHPELTIFVNGTEVLVPKDLGVTPSCMTAIHTHGEKHVLHVESPVQKDFTLGDFFAVWKKDFSRIKLLDNVVTDSSEILVTVNGVNVDTYENTILRDKDQVVISYRNK